MIAAELLAGWEAAYRRTEYRVLLPRTDLVLQVDIHHETDDRRLRDECGVQTHWAILTPCNPNSASAPEKENARSLEELTQIVEGLNLRYFISVNGDPQGQWPDEPGFLLCDPGPDLAEQLGRRFGQNAILAGRLGEAPRLLWLIGP